MKALLVVVDYQKDFVNGALGFDGAQLLDDRICAKIEDYTGAGADIVFTLDTHGDDYLETREGKNLPVPHCIKGSDGWQLYGKTAAHRTAGSICFEKPCFGSMELAKFAQNGGYELVELCGLVSSICVLSNAVLIKAALPQARVIVDARCTAGADQAAHEKALDVLEGVQVEVIGRNDVSKAQAMITGTLTPEGRDIRVAVFMDEQGFKREFDEMDTAPDTKHLLLCMGGEGVGVGRMFPTPGEADSYTVGRIAVMPRFRGHGVGAVVMRSLEKQAKELGAHRIRLSAQLSARPFYETLDYTAHGDIFYDEHCPHIAMSREL